jgi:hypothetical protein
MLQLFLCNKFVVPKNKGLKIATRVYEMVFFLTRESSCGFDVLIFDASRLYRFFVNDFI